MRPQGNALRVALRWVGLEVGSGSRVGVPFDTPLPQCLHWRPLLPGSHDVRDEELCLSTFLQP